MFGSIGRAVRASFLLGLAATAAVASFRLTDGLRHPDGTYEELLVAGAAWILALGTTWAALVCAAAVLEVTSAGRVVLTARLGCPAPARRLVLATIGVVLAGGGALVTSPVVAAPVPLDESRAGHSRVVALPVPSRPTEAAYSVPHQRRVEVQPGDSLWQISRERSRAASASDVARVVERTYRSNRGVIGPDPDLIQPGQRLVLPRQRPPTPHS